MNIPMNIKNKVNKFKEIAKHTFKSVRQKIDRYN